MVNHERVYRLYRKNGLARRIGKRRKKPVKAKSCIMPGCRPDQNWAMDFMADSCGANSKMRTLNIVDTFSRECVAIVVGRSLPASGVIDALRNLKEERCLPESITVDNGPEYTSGVCKEWVQGHGITLNYITPGKPMESLEKSV